MFDNLERNVASMEELIGRLSREITDLRGALEQAKKEAAADTAANGLRCATCGAPLDTDAVFCTSCGSRVEAVAAAPATSPAPAIDPEPMPEATPEPEFMPEAEAEPEPTPEPEPMPEPEPTPEPEPMPEPTPETEPEPTPEPAELAFCTNCGTKLLPGSLFCPECGTRLPR